MNERIRWFRSKLAKRGRTAHRAGHWRKGQNFTKCGHPIGREVSEDVARGYLDPCTLCDNEALKERCRIERVAQSPADVHAVRMTPDPKPVHPHEKMTREGVA